MKKLQVSAKDLGAHKNLRQYAAQKNSALKILRDTIIIFLGNAVLAFSIAAFIEPTGIICGGTAGIGLFVQFYFRLPISITLAAVNSICFILGFLILGRQFSATTLLSTIISPFILRFFESIPSLSSLTDDLFLSSVMAGVLAGIGVGLVIQAGASTGGMDIPPLILHKTMGIPVGTVMLFLDGIILLLQLPSSNPEQILYGIVKAFLTSVTLNKVLTLGSQQAQLLIISSHYNIIRKTLLQADAGVTMIPIETGYVGTQLKAVFCAIPVQKLPKIKSMVADIDETSFMIVTSAAEISGRGFTLPR